ncbi:hypothetical protein PILCRDRAFT_565568 [Piloderma croceum F 1598]|uniref:Uncharacterized protein n=1 Tax=Piloderma croceum (strain F 1598) TaxID=765440 RepID=A0A0C3FI91_PILCF|nr:hypothetical protein PILCRDRAFT_565568 [Piloderma croceum F 1598]
MHFLFRIFIVDCRCASPTCPVCSRTCTAPPPSQPHTPYLTYSPTPTTTPSLPPTPLPLPTSLPPSASPRRTALGLTSLNINNASFSGPLGVNGAVGGGRRRKFKDEEGNLEAAGEGEGKVDEGSPKGCGRVMCKGCCEESWQRLVWIFLAAILCSLYRGSIDHGAFCPCPVGQQRVGIATTVSDRRLDILSCFSPARNLQPKEYVWRQRVVNPKASLQLQQYPRLIHSRGLCWPVIVCIKFVVPTYRSAPPCMCCCVLYNE